MPLHAERPIVRVEPGSMHTIETRNPENLFGLWSVFSKCSPAMEDGKRYENLAWRLWSRETFCCAHDHTFPPRWSFDRRVTGDAAEPPELSSSVASDDSISDSAITATTRSNSSISRPKLGRQDSTASQARGKHTTPIDLEKVVSSIQERKAIEPLSPLPELLARPVLLPTTKPSENTTPRPSSPPRVRYVPQSSSTVATAVDSNSTSPPVGSDTSACTEVSTHSVVHGFSPTHISTSIRSSTNLNPNPILKNSVVPRSEFPKVDLAKKKKTVFTLGGSSDEDTLSSFEHSYMAKHTSLSDNMQRSGPMSKVTSFKEDVTTRTFQEASEESEEAIETESEEDSDDNAIEDDDSDDEDWEDDDNSGPSSLNEREMFKRVDSKPNLTSRRSLLTTLMHERDRASALQNAASRSTPAIRRSRASSPNGPSTGVSPPEDGGLMMRTQVPRSKPIIMTTSNVHPPALSPRTTRRNMLQTELTQSLRQNLLWERQQKNSTKNAVNKRAQSAVNLPALRRAMTTSDIQNMNGRDALPPALRSSTIREAAKNSSFNDYFDQGLGEYHHKGW
ncbi:DUF1752-domain-containing protein [Westerdykella ornata]|uniref:DUF1752-domain-containing protein n=1 Tax=Westerdykella ornata TaxID=318751 RepID=A0A6A6JLG6_WESOR|nr:DUF1752-domain-containing protein [Westerdykella ornata]KAF2276496.1 DUF1752-domain-containing protein [Westerdykella ornata]